VGVIMLDLDHFKNFNDTHGHEAGDMLLRLLGDYLVTHVRAEDIACRYGGEEFVVILPEASPEMSRSRAEELWKGVQGLHVNFHGALLRGVAGLAERVPVRPAQKDRARRSHLLAVAPDDRDTDRRDAPPLDLALDQTHGLVADRSAGGEQHNVHSGFLQPRGHLGGCPALERLQMGPRDVPHKSVPQPRNGADLPECGQLTQPFDGQHDVEIVVGVRVVVVVVRDHQRIEGPLQVEFAERRVPVVVVHVVRRLLAVVDPGGGDERDRRGREWFRHRDPRHDIILSFSVVPGGETLAKRRERGRERGEPAVLQPHQ
jgi:hypothetical protein